MWLAYSADRWIEGWRLTEASVRTRRHAFFLRHRWSTFAVWVTAVVSTGTLAVRELTAREWGFSFTLLGIALLYLLSHQLIHRCHPWRVPKELCVATILTLGVGLYPAANLSASLQILAGPAALFFLLALANCLLISEWEREVDVSQGQTSLALRYATARRLASWLPWAILVVAIASATILFVRTPSICGAVSAVSLGFLAALAPRLGRKRARVLADLALFTPLAGLPWA